MGSVLINAMKDIAMQHTLAGATSCDSSSPSESRPWFRWFVAGRARTYASGLMLFGFLCALLSCTNQAPGISPDPTLIHYPTGIAVHPSGKYLYVANSNFDLAFTGGTVMVFHTDESKEIEVDRAGIKTKIKTLELMQGATVEIGSFAGQLLLNKAGTRAYVAIRQDRRTDSPLDLSAVTTLEIQDGTNGKDHLKCNNTPVLKEKTGGVGAEDKFEKEPAPKCGDASKTFLDESPYPYSMMMISSCRAKRTCQQDKDCVCEDDAKKQNLCQFHQQCDTGRCVEGCRPGTCKQGETCHEGRCRTDFPTGQSCQSDSDCGTGERCDNTKCTPGCSRQIDCPTGQECLLGRCRTPLPARAPFCTGDQDCAAWESCENQRLLAAHIEKGGLSDFSIDPKTGAITRVVKNILILPAGVTYLSMLPPNPISGASGDIFVSSTQTDSFYILPHQLPPADNTLISVPFINTDGTTSTIADLRGIAVGYDRKSKIARVFVAARRPTPAVLVYRLALDANKQLIATLQGFVPVGNNPGQVVYHPRPAPYPDLVYVVGTQEGRIDAINTETLQIDYQIPVGEQPAFIAIYEPRNNTDIQRRRMYVSNFLDTTISIIDLNNHRVIGQVSGIDTRMPLP